jgi:predicted kinase
MSLLLLQGIPGSGKSTRARVLSIERTAVILSTDDYHVNAEGQYEFNRELARHRHSLNQERCRYFLQKGVNVIIDNTTLDNRSAHPYVVMAVALGIPVEFIRCTGDYGSIHGVPEETMTYMRNRLEPLSIEAALAAKPW